MNRNLFYSVLIVSLTFAPILRGQDKDVRALAGTFADALAKVSKKSVAVVDFTDLQGNVTELGRYLAEQLSVSLAMTGKGIEVVDRTHLKALLQEHKLGSSGVIDPATAKKLGQIAGVDVLVTGSLTPFGDSVQLAVKALDTTSARILTASMTDIAKTRAIEELLGRGITPAVGGVASAPGGGAGTATSSLPTVASAEVMEIQFALISCKGSSNGISCRVLCTNKGEDRKLEVFGRGSRYDTLIIDETGSQYKISEVLVGNQRSEGTLVSGVPTMLTLSFDGVKSMPSRIALLEFRCWVKDKREVFAVQLRQIPITK